MDNLSGTPFSRGPFFANADTFRCLSECTKIAHRRSPAIFIADESASPKPHPSKPRPCNMPQAKTEVALQFSECCAAETALQHWLFCSAEVIWTKSCAAANEKLHCNIEKAALQESGAFLPLSCGFQAPTFRHPRLGPAERGYRREFRSEDHFYPFSSQKKSRFVSDFLRRRNRASWGLEKSRDFWGSGKNRHRSRRESRDFGALSCLLEKH